MTTIYKSAKSLLLAAALLLPLSLGAAASSVTYTVASTTSVNATGDVPQGSSATFKNTYTTKDQLTSGNSMTLTLSGFNGLSVSKLTLSMKSNSKKGAGSLSYSTDGGTTYTYLVGSSSSGVNFKDPAWNGSYTDSYVDIVKDVEITPTTSDFVIKIEGTTNSIYCQSFTIDYTASATPQEPCTVYFNAGSGSCATASLTEASAGAGVTLPEVTAPTGWDVAGWAEASVAEATTDAPTLYAVGDTYYPLADDTTLYAVFTRYDEGAGSSLAQTLQHGSWSYNEDNGTTTDKGDYRLFGDGAYIESASFDLSRLVKVIVYGGTFGGTTYCNFSITDASGNVWKTGSVSGSSQTGSNEVDNTDCTPLAGNGTLRIVSNSGNGTGTGVRISKVEIYCNGANVYHSTPAGVEIVDVTGVSILPAEEVSVVVGSTTVLTAVVAPADATDKSVSWTSDTPSVATVAADGTVTGVTAGTAQITVTTTDGEFTATKTVTVTPIPTVTVSWSASGSVVSTSSVTQGTAVGSLPVAPAVDGYEFRGWCTASTVESDGSDITYVAAETVVNEAVTFYAVYYGYDESAPGDNNADQTLEYDTWKYSGDTSDKSNYRLFGANAYVESAEFDLSTLQKVIVYGGTFGGGTYNSVSITDADGKKWLDGTVSGKSQTGVNTFTGGTALAGDGKLRIVSNSGDGSSSGVRISKVEIFISGAYVYTTAPVPVVIVHVDGVTVSPAELTLMVTESAPLTATVTPAEAKDKRVSWTSSNPSVATVGADGTVTGVTVGNAVITVTTTDGEFTATASVTVTPIPTYTVTWSANGNLTYTVYTSGDTVGPLPSADDVDEYSFVGWTDTRNINSDGSDIVYLTADAVITAPATYYAVYSKLIPSENPDPVQTLSYDDWTYDGPTLDKSTYRMFGTGAYVESEEFNLSTLGKVVVTAGSYGGDSYNSFSITDDKGKEWKTGTSSTNKLADYEITGGNRLTGLGKLRVVSTCGNGTSNGLRLSQVKIYEAGTNVYTTSVKLTPEASFADPQYTFEDGATVAVMLVTNTDSPVAFTVDNASLASIVPDAEVKGLVSFRALDEGTVILTATAPASQRYRAAVANVVIEITGVGAKHLDEINLLAESEPFALAAPMAVTYAYGPYVYVYEPANDTYGLIYDTGNKLAQADMIDSGWTGHVSIDNGQPRLVPDDELMPTGDVASLPAPFEIGWNNSAVLDANMAARPVKLRDILLDDYLTADGGETTVSAYLVDVNLLAPAHAPARAAADTRSIVLRNVFNTTPNSALAYDSVDGIANINGSSIEIYPTSFGSISTALESALAGDIPGTPRFYTLSGMLIPGASSADRLTPGAYLMVQPGRPATKIIVR